MCDSYYYNITTEEPQVRVFHDDNCQGGSRLLPVGTQYTFDNQNPGHDAISSVVVPPHMRLQLSEHNWPGGQILTLDGGPHPRLGQYGWNDRASGSNVTRHVDWGTWMNQCCRNERDDSLCPGGFRHPNDSNCYNYMNSYCSSGANMWDGLCAQWGPVESKKQEYCNTGPHFAEKRCQEWCTKRNPDGTVNFGKCDAGARQYCGPDGNPNDLICSCINSKVSKYNPACVDAICATNGYLTSTQSALQCPTIVDCSMVLDLQSKGVQTVGNISQNCTADGAAKQGESPASAQAPIEKTTNSLMIFILIFLVIIMVGMAVGMYYIFTSLRSSNNYTSLTK